jgi:hypothetical protein
MRLYYFTGAQHALNNIALRRLKISLIKTLNDPYELSAINMRDPEIRKKARVFIDGINNRMGMICFSSSYQSPLMWAHYADKHAGICLGFDVSEDWFFQVEYIKDLIKFDRNFDLTESDAKKLLSAKHESWAYEQEYRIFCPLKDKKPEHGNYFEGFSNHLKLIEVILGHRCDISLETIKKLTGQFADPVYVLKTRLAFTKFQVVEDKSFRSSKL